MALINHAKREINAKIVYFGPEGVGKRKSLQFIYDRIKPSLRGDLKSPSSSGDSLFFFDFCPFENTVFGDYRIRFHVYTLPGKVSNPAAWKMTLKGADGLVVVADAAPELANAAQETISVLRGYLAVYGVGLHDIPCVVQLNKASNPVYSSAAGMAAALDLPEIQVCLFDPVSGEGVLEVLSLLSRQIMTRIGQDDGLRTEEGSVTSVDKDDAEVSAALLSLDMDTDERLDQSHQMVEEKELFSASVDEMICEQLHVALAGEGASSSEGVVRIPLEFAFGGATCQLVVSIAIDRT